MGRKAEKKNNKCNNNYNHRRNLLNWPTSPNHLQIHPKWHLNVEIFFLFMSLPHWLLLNWERALQRDLLVCSFSSFEVGILFPVQLYQSYLQDFLHFLFEKKIFWVFLSPFPVPVWSVPHKYIWKQPLSWAVQFVIENTREIGKHRNQWYVHSWFFSLFISWRKWIAKVNSWV